MHTLSKEYAFFYQYFTEINCGETYPDFDKVISS